MAIKGQVDGMEGCYVVGWAAAEPDTGNCAITIVSAEGEQVAKGRASRHRPDLASLGLGRTTLAFRIALKPTDEPRTLHVLANGEELPNSPLTIGPGQFDGHGTVENGAVAGWVTERLTEFAAPYITVLDQRGQEVGRGQASFEAKSIDPVFNPARFSVELDDRCFGAGALHLTLLANGVPFDTRNCELALRGNLEIINAGHCAGWMVSASAPARAFAIEIFRDAKLAASATCEHVREDVRALFPECSTPGFAATLPPAGDGLTQSHVISLRMAGSDTELFDGPYVITNRAGAVSAAYRAARLANMDLPGIGPAERAVLQLALGNFIASARQEHGFTAAKQIRASTLHPDRPRLVVIIPVYRGVDITRGCIDSVLTHRNPATDRLILINDQSPDAGMAAALAHYAGHPNLEILTNTANAGFVQTVNRGMALAGGADVLLLNSDTVIHEGGLDELLRLAAAHPEIGTITAMSNNATIFSYPHATLRKARLADVSWPELAALALAENAGAIADVPTGHGFCMFIRGEVIRRIGLFDESFGRGYGEENDFCARSAAIGYRHVAAGGVLVEHKESISFVDERPSLMAQNMPRLAALYPEYHPIIQEFERTDGLRALRWALDRARLRRAAQAGQEFVLIIGNHLEGGSAKAILDIERAGYGAAAKLLLRCTDEGLLELSAEDPLVLANFAFSEIPELFALLDAANPSHVLAHQLLGFPAEFIRAVSAWANTRHAVFFAHDFYTFCPRVTMIDAVGSFCNVADAATCARCVAMDGAHDASRLTELTPLEHRALFSELFGAFRHILAPSADAAGYLSRAFPGLALEVLAHPEAADNLPDGPREGSFDEIILLGAIGPHKGSATLLDLARRARLSHPHLTFRVIGYTDIDKALKAIGNVTITGKFEPAALPKLLAQSRGKLALFLQNWPETYSYTLSEAVRSGLIPLVPDIGAPAARVRAARYGVVFDFPASAAPVLAVIDAIAAGRLAPVAEGASPAAFFPGAEVLDRMREVLAMPMEEEKKKEALF